MRVFLWFFKNIKEGDYVMACIQNEFNHTCYIPGIVHLINNDRSNPNFKEVLYTVLYFNGEEDEAKQKDIFKIKKNEYSEIVKYIRAKQGKKYENSIYFVMSNSTS